MKHTLYTLSALLLLALSSFAKGDDSQKEISVVPLPNSISYADGAFDSKRELRVYAPSEFEKTIEIVGKRFEKSLPNFSAKLSSKKLANVVVKKDESIAAEAYKLNVSANNVEILASSKSGVIYAFQTLLQAMGQSGKIPCCKIEDAPRFKWRGFMIDPARNFFGKQFILDTIDRLVELKMNVLHIHLTDHQGWRIEIKKYPKLTEVGAWYHETAKGGYLTQDDAREIVAYAAERGITVIPEIEALSHATAAAKSYPFLGDGYGINVYDPAVKEFFKDVLREIMDIFPSKIIHLAGDEVVYKVWENNPKIKEYMQKRGLKTMLDIHLDYMNEMGAFLEANGRKMVAWDEAFGKGEMEVKNGLSASNAKASKNTIMHFWTGNEPAMIEAANDGYEVINANLKFTYFNYAPHSETKFKVIPLPKNRQLDDTDEKYYSYVSKRPTPLKRVYNFKPIPQGVTENARKNIIGTSCQLWNKPISSISFFEYLAFPRTAALAEVAWTNPEKKNYTSFANRLKSLQNLWDYAGINHDYQSVPETSEFYPKTK